MAEKTAELKSAMVAQHMAEAQVLDLQQRVLELQMSAPKTVRGSPELQVRPPPVLTALTCPLSLSKSRGNGACFTGMDIMHGRYFAGQANLVIETAILKSCDEETFSRILSVVTSQTHMFPSSDC